MFCGFLGYEAQPFKIILIILVCIHFIYMLTYIKGLRLYTSDSVVNYYLLVLTQRVSCGMGPNAYKNYKQCKEKIFALKTPGLGPNSFTRQWSKTLSRFLYSTLPWARSVVFNFNDFNKRLVKREAPRPHPKQTKFEFLEGGTGIYFFLQVILTWIFK